MGLMVHYRKGEVFREFCGSLVYLALLPLDIVKKACNPFEVAELLDCFDTTYVTVKYKMHTKPPLTMTQEQTIIVEA